MKAQSTIRRNLKELRAIIETSNNPIETRIAYAMEQAVRWAVEDTRGWPSLAKDAKDNADILASELNWKMK